MDKQIVIKVVRESKDDLKKVIMQLLLKSYIRQLASKEGTLC